VQKREVVFVVLDGTEQCAYTKAISKENQATKTSACKNMGECSGVHASKVVFVSLIATAGYANTQALSKPIHAK